MATLGSNWKQLKVLYLTRVFLPGIIGVLCVCVVWSCQLRQNCLHFTIMLCCRFKKLVDYTKLVREVNNRLIGRAFAHLVNCFAHPAQNCPPNILSCPQKNGHHNNYAICDLDLSLCKMINPKGETPLEHPRNSLKLVKYLFVEHYTHLRTLVHEILCCILASDI